MVVRLLAASIVGGIAFFILGFLIYGLLLDPMVMKPNMISYPGLMNETPIWVPLVLANIVNALLLAYIFDTWAGIRTFMGGLRGGAVVMFLIALAMQLFFASFMNLSKNFTPAIADIVGSTVLGAIGGGVIGQVLGMMNKDGASA